jgi:nucleoside-diphosphate-sugar epimerase
VTTEDHGVLEAGSRVLVTGGTGFIGSHLVEVLSAQNVRPRMLVRRTSQGNRLPQLAVEWVEGDLRDTAALAEAVRGVDIVFHLAAVTRARSEREYYDVNAEGTRALIAAVLAARPQPHRVVYLSSLAAAGPSVNGRPITREDLPQPITAYGRSKLAGEQACLAATPELEIVALRAPAVYGPRDRDLYRYFRLAALGIVPVPAGPDCLLQFIHVYDLVEALLSAAVRTNATGVYHVAEPRSYTWSELVTWIARAVGRRVRALHIPPWVVHAAAVASEAGAALRGRATIFNREKVREILAPGWQCETDAIKQDLGFAARIPLPVGLTATAAWYRAEGWL